MTDGFFVVSGPTRFLFAAGDENLPIYLGIMVVLIVAISAVVFVVNRVFHRWRYNSHASLFRGLCRVHGLDRKTRGLLKQLAQHHRLSQPALLFVEPKWFSPKTLGTRFASQQKDLMELAKRLFGKKS